jgi:tight adherence protein C
VSQLLDLPGWLAGTLVASALVVIVARPLLASARVGRRLESLPRAPGRSRATSSSGLSPQSSSAPIARRRLVALGLAVVATAMVAPALVPVVLGGAWVWPRWRATASVRRRDQELARELPEVVDLLLVATVSGLNLSHAVSAMGERGPPRLGAALARAATDIDEGVRVADALDAALSPLGGPARPLAAALLGSARYGTSLGPALDRLAIETRQLRRRQAEEAVRRVPIKLLFPLVLLVLPAFVLLTLVPLLAGAFRSLPL